MNSAFVRAPAPPGPLTPLAPLAPVTGAELLSPQPASTIAPTAAPSERYAHLPHTERIKVARATQHRWSENPRISAVFHPSSLEDGQEGGCGPGTRTPNSCSRGRRVAITPARNSSAGPSKRSSAASLSLAGSDRLEIGIDVRQRVLLARDIRP